MVRPGASAPAPTASAAHRATASVGTALSAPIGVAVMSVRIFGGRRITVRSPGLAAATQRASPSTAPFALT